MPRRQRYNSLPTWHAVESSRHMRCERYDVVKPTVCSLLNCASHAVSTACRHDMLSSPAATNLVKKMLFIQTHAAPKRCQPCRLNSLPTWHAIESSRHMRCKRHYVVQPTACRLPSRASLAILTACRHGMLSESSRHTECKKTNCCLINRMPPPKLCQPCGLNSLPTWHAIESSRHTECQKTTTVVCPNACRLPSCARHAAVTTC